MTRLRQLLVWTQRARLDLDLRDWWVGYYRGELRHYVCPLPCLVISWPRDMLPVHAWAESPPYTPRPTLVPSLPEADAPMWAHCLPGMQHKAPDVILAPWRPCQCAGSTGGHDHLIYGSAEDLPVNLPHGGPYVGVHPEHVDFAKYVKYVTFGDKDAHGEHS